MSYSTEKLMNWKTPFPPAILSNSELAEQLHYNLLTDLSLMHWIVFLIVRMDLVMFVSSVGQPHTWIRCQLTCAAGTPDLVHISK